jgi:hypothetical protein
MGERKNAYKIFVRKLEGKRSFRRPGNRWEDNIKMDLRKKKGSGKVWTGYIWFRIRISRKLLRRW